jgi:hypothetical protein
MAVFVIAFMVLFGTSIVNAQINTGQARSYKNDVIAELENSDYNPIVISDCVRQAEENGYTLSISPYRQTEDGNTTTEAVGNENADGKKIVAADVKLAYQYKLTFLGNSKTHFVRGIAR